MALSLSQLLKPITESEALATGLEILSDLGFTATSWFAGSIQRTLVQLYARLSADQSESVAEVTKSGFVTLATAEYLDYLGLYSFGGSINPTYARVGATPTKGVMRLTSTLAAPAHSWGAGEIVIADAANDPANTYTIDDAGVLAPGGSIFVNVTAQAPGSAANIANGTTLYLWTALTGVTVLNFTNAPGSSSWIATAGQDAETDSRYASRLIGRFETLGYAGSDGAYTTWVKEAVPSITRVTVQHIGNGQITITCAKANGTIDAGDITTIVNYLTGVTDGKGRRVLGDIITVQSATALTTPAVGVTLYRKSTAPPAVTLAQTALLDYLASVPIGGTYLPGDSAGRVLFASMLEAAMGKREGFEFAGIVNAVFSSPANVDVTGLTATQIYTPSITIGEIVVP
jgi:uncharacterized phage protein gp47/JayE